MSAVERVCLWGLSLAALGLSVANKVESSSYLSRTDTNRLIDSKIATAINQQDRDKQYRELLEAINSNGYRDCVNENLFSMHIGDRLLTFEQCQAEGAEWQKSNVLEKMGLFQSNMDALQNGNTEEGGN